MLGKNMELTAEDYKKICILDSILFVSCTNEEQAEQMIRIIQNRQKEKLCAKPTKSHIV
jgi:hypothetical protein